MTVAVSNARATEPATATTIDRGLAFLAKDAVAWRDEFKCASCHHASLVVWAMQEAKGRGHTVDEPLLLELTAWISEGEGKTGVPRPEGIPKALNTKAVYFALGLNSDPQPSDAARQGLARFWKTEEADQIENGSWAAWPETRPPFFGGSDESMTALATLALLPAAAAGDEAAVAARDKAVQWLQATKSDDDPQSVAMRLVLFARLDRPAEELAPLVARIKERQNTDGGWSQAVDMASDAWATGQALYALDCAGSMPDDAAIARGHAFLIATQNADGSWPMTSRPTKPGGAGSTSLVPIIGAGSAWAVIGLSRSE
ncbi:MAG: prenyltransferase/squalene oxidase repeat-containing protein [Pirellulales bacterium]